VSKTNKVDQVIKI